MAEEYVISVVLEGNASSLSSATEKASKGQKKLKTSTADANIAMLAQLARFQAMTAAMNQTVGGLNKMTGALEAAGAPKALTNTMRSLTKVMEFIIGPMEIYLAYKTLSIALHYSDAKAKTTDAAATGVLATATGALNAVMALNPFILVAMAIIVVSALFILEKKFGLVTKMVDGFNNSLESMEDHFMKIVNLGKGVASVMGKIGNIASGRGLAKLAAGAK